MDVDDEQIIRDYKEQKLMDTLNDFVENMIGVDNSFNKNNNLNFMG